MIVHIFNNSFSQIDIETHHLSLIIGLSGNVETIRAKSMLRLIPPQLSTEEHTTMFRKSIEVNNLVYSYTFQAVFTILSFTIGKKECINVNII